MVSVRVGDDDASPAPGPLACQERHDHPAAGIAVAASRTRVDQHPTPPRRTQHRTIALPHIEKM